MAEGAGSLHHAGRLNLGQMATYKAAGQSARRVKYSQWRNLTLDWGYLRRM